MDTDSPDFAHAFEDLPDEARQQAAEIASTQPGISLRRRVREELETFGLDSYGTLEESRLLRFLSRYPVTPYTYTVSALVARGQRPDAAKLAALVGGGRLRATINLCAEMPDGDAPAIERAGLAGQLQTTHVPITDMESPTIAQLTEMLDLLSGPGCEPTYVHCEAGKGRTGVAIACYRMAVAGWSAADALTEAVNFGCIVPGQQAFISTFGAMLQAGPVAGRYPLLPLGSVRATPAQLSATIRTAAEADSPLLPPLLSHSPLPRPAPGAKGQSFSSNRYAWRHASIIWVAGPAAPVSAQRCPRGRGRGPAENGNAKVCEGIPTMSEQPAIQYAELLRQLRAELGLTQEELASAAGISPRTISDLERGINQTPRKATAELLADALGLIAPRREEFMAAARRRPATSPGAAGTPADGTSAADAGDPADDADASNVVWIDSAASAAFVDREEELGVLREAWSGAKAGRRVLALVAGEPGIGKTALTAELARLVSADGGLVLYGRWDEHVPAPYQAFREALNDYARACPDAVLRRDLAGLAEEIARLCPEPAHRVGASAAPQAAAQAERFRLFESLDTWIGRIAARHPVLLVLDDLQWADQPSFFLLPHLMRARRSTPLLTVAMYRNLGPERSEFSTALPSLTRDVDCRRVSLRGLEHRAVTALLEDAVGRPFGERESGMVAELEWETAGNPFFLLEMARHLSEVGAFDRDVVRLGDTSAEIPQSIRDMVRSRLRRLTGGCAETLAVAALIGERFDAALLASAAELTDPATVDLLEEAAGAGLIAETDDDPDHWRFSHSLTRRVTSEELSRGRRAVFHQRIGETLEGRPGVAAAELAHHFGAAAGKGSAVKAVRYGRQAGRRALAEVAAEVAVRHFRRALELLDRFGPEDQALRCELLLDLAGAHDRAGEYPVRDERFAEAADNARRLGSGELFARAALGYGGVLPATVRPDPRAQALLEEALGRLDERDDATRATILARLAHWLHNVRPYPERLELSDRSVAMARRSQDRRTLATVLLHRCWALDGPGDVGDSLRVAGEVLKIGAELGDPALTLEGLRIQLAAQFESGRHSAAVQTAQEMKTLAEVAGHPEFIRLAAMWDIVAATMEGRFSQAEELAGELGRRLDQIGHSQAQLISVAQSASWRLLQGYATEYIAPFEAMSAADPGNLAWPAITAWCLAEAGAGDRAAELLSRTDPALAADADKNYLWWAVVVGFSGAVDLVGDRRWAEALYDLAAPYSGSNCTLGVASFLGAADHWLGVLATVAGRYTEAATHLEAALTRHRALGARPWTALTEEAYGRALSLRGRPADLARAAALTESAMRTAAELDLAAIAGRPRLRG